MIQTLINAYNFTSDFLTLAIRTVKPMIRPNQLPNVSINAKIHHNCGVIKKISFGITCNSVCQAWLGPPGESEGAVLDEPNLVAENRCHLASGIRHLMSNVC